MRRITKKDAEVVKDNGTIEFQIRTENPLIKEFLDTLEVLKYSTYTIKNYSWILNNFYDFIKRKGVEITDVDTKTILEFIKSKNIKENSIKNYVSCFSVFFDYLNEDRRISRNPITTRIQKAFKKNSNSNREPFSKEEIEAIRQAEKKLMWQAITELFLSSGLRGMELIKLDVEDIDFKTGKITVKEGKGGKSRITFMSTHTSELLSRYLLIRFKTRGQAKREPPEKALFVSREKRRLSPKTVRGHYYKLSKKIGVHIYPHRFRHTFASILVEAKADFVAVQRLLGHSSKLGVTDLYTHVSEEWLFREYSKGFK